MEYFFIIIAILLAIITFVGLGSTLFGLAKGMRLIFLYLFKDPINRYLLFKPLETQYKKILQDCFVYYQRLSPKDKILFEKRVQKFIGIKEFIPKEPLDSITPEMKVLVAASAIQLTFGLPGIYFKHFKYIHIYPDFYFSEAMFQFNSGEVHKTGNIFLSWKDFLEGYLDPSNGRNLGLHEMAHALRFENLIKNEEYSYLKWKDIDLLNEITVTESEKILNGGKSLLREYAAIHYQEFFAVLIEVFFEKPQELLDYHPELYYVTTRLIRQDPLKTHSSAI